MVPVHRLQFGGLETQTRPLYNAASLLNADYAPVLIAHELAHMWFGDNVTVREWNDIFNNEAYASWAQWELLSGRAVGPPTPRSTRPTAGLRRRPASGRSP